MKHEVALPTSRFEFGGPARSDHYDYGLAAGDGLLDGFGEVLPGSDVLHVHEDVVGTEDAAQMFGQASCMSRRVVTPIADEYGVQMR